MGWLWQNLISNLAWEILLLVGGAASLGYLKKKVPEHASTIAYALFGATCVAILLFTITGHGLLVKTRSAVTPENLAENIRKWADDSGLGVTKMPADQEVYFGFLIRLQSGNQLTVFRGKEKAGWLQIQIPNGPLVRTSNDA